MKLVTKNPTLARIILMALMLSIQCDAFSPRFGAVTSGWKGVNDGTATKHTVRYSFFPSLFRNSFLLQQDNNNSNNISIKLASKSSTSTTTATTTNLSDNEKLSYEMLLVLFNVCSVLLVALRCYYHFVAWSRASRKQISVLEDLRLKAEKKLQDLDEEQQQKLNFWSQQASQHQHQQNGQHPNGSINHNMHYKGYYIGQACPICWQDFQSMCSGAATATTSLTKDEPMVSETTNLLYKKQMLMGGSDGKPIKSLPCGHSFDRSCLVEWVVTLHKKNRDSPLTCPVCREAF